MSGQQRLSALTAVTELKLQAARARLAEVATREAALRDNLAQLEQTRRNPADLLDRTPDPATIAGADLRWQRWADQRRAAITAELARVLAEKAQATRALARAFGRDAAARGLQDKADAAARQIAARRAAYES